MAQKNKLTPLASAIGVTVVAGLAAMPLAQASGNPFSMNDLSAGYKVAAEGQCGEGKCGNKMKDKKEGHCGGKEGKKDGKDGHCGAKESKGKEGKCGGNK